MGMFTLVGNALTSNILAVDGCAGDRSHVGQLRRDVLPKRRPIKNSRSDPLWVPSRILDAGRTFLSGEPIPGERTYAHIFSPSVRRTC